MKKKLLILLTWITAITCLAGGTLTLTPEVMADDETSLQAGVVVNDSHGEYFGVEVVDSRQVWFRQAVLGEPDGFGAIMFKNARMEIKLEGTAENCREISIWTGYYGWGNLLLHVYTSKDGRRWKHAGIIRLHRQPTTRYTLTGDFGDVSYIKIQRSGWHWSYNSLDAISAKGGDK